MAKASVMADDTDFFQTDFPDVTPAEGRWPKATTPGTMPNVGESFQSYEKPETTASEKLSDVGNTAAAQGTLGLLADVPGMFGTVGHYVDVAAQTIPKYTVVKPLEYMGVIPQGTSEKFDKYIASQQAQLPENEQRGDVQRMFGIPFPTVQGMETNVKENIPYTTYEPVTTPGEYAGSAARFAANAGPMGELKAIPAITRMGEAAISGATSEAAGQLSENMGWEAGEPYMRLLGGIMGGPAAKGAALGIKSVAFPNVGAENGFAQALAQDYAEGKAPYTQQQLQDMINSGATVTAYDMAGPNARAYIEKYGNMSLPEARALQNKLAERSTNAVSGVSDTINNLYPDAIDPAVKQAKITEENQKQIKALYDLANQSPEAQAVWSPTLEKLSNIKDIKTAMKKASDIATDPESGIVTPNFNQASGPAMPIYDASGNVIKNVSPVSSTPNRLPNLQFWDQVKRNLDDQIGSAINTGQKDEVRRLTNLKSRLLNELDSKVEGYANARSAASDNFGASNALEAGYNSMKGMNAFKSQDFTDAFNKMSDSEKQLFAEGAVGYLNENIQNNGLNSFLKSVSKPAIAQRIKLAIGEENYNQILGRAQSEHLLQNTPSPELHAPSSALSQAATTGVTTGALTTAGEMAYNAFQHGLGSGMTGTQQAVALGALITGAAGRGLYTAAEMRWAPEVIKLASSTAPEDIKRLGQLADQNFAVKTFLEKTKEFGGKALVGQIRANPPSETKTNSQPQQPAQQSTGGRIERKHGGKVGHQHLVDRLMRLAERAKKEVNKGTEPLLNANDTAVAKALAVANKHI